MADPLEIAGQLRRRGHYPASWAHHPAVVRAALRRHQLRPSFKACHRNSQLFLLRVEELRSRLEYREGWVSSGRSFFEHAWLTLDGDVLDLTLDSRSLRYLASYAVPLDEMVRAIERANGHTFVRPEQLESLRAEAFARARAPLLPQYENMFPRLLNAVTTMAKDASGLRERLAWVAADVAVFAESDIPPSLLAAYREFCELVNDGVVPDAYRAHPHPVKSSPTFWISPAKAKRAAHILAEMFERVAYRRAWTEGQLQGVEFDDEVEEKK